MVKVIEKEQEATLQVVLTEYQVLRKGMMEKFRIHMLLFSLTVASSIIAVAIAFATRAYDIMHILSFISLACFFRVAWEQSLIRRVSGYLKTMEEKTIPALLGNTEKSLTMGWQHQYESDVPPKKYFKYSFQMGFVALSAMISLLYALFVITQPFGCCTAASRLPIEINTILLVIHAGIAVWTFNKINSW